MATKRDLIKQIRGISQDAIDMIIRKKIKSWEELEEYLYSYFTNIIEKYQKRTYINYGIRNEEDLRMNCLIEMQKLINKKYKGNTIDSILEGKIQVKSKSQQKRVRLKKKI